LEHDQAGLASDGWAAKFFLYLTNIIFFRKVGMGDFRKKLGKSIGLKLSCSPSFLALNFHVLVLKIEFLNQIQKERKSGKSKL
jgi:hypothetical protein